MSTDIEVYCEHCGKIIPETQASYYNDMILCSDCYDKLVLNDLSSTYNLDIEL